MSLLARLFAPPAPAAPAVPAVQPVASTGAGPGGPYDDYWYRAVRLPSHSGVEVTPESALTISAVWACVRVLSENVAGLPLVLYQRRPDGSKRRARHRRLYRLLKDAPNPQMSSFDMRVAAMTHLLLRGNAYIHVVLDRAGEVERLNLLHPDRVTVEQTASGALRYVVEQRTPATPAARSISLAEDEVIHIRGLTTNGYTGLSVVSHARETLGLALATEAYGARFFKQDARPGGVLQHPGTLSDAAAARLAASWRNMHAGAANAHQVAILEEGVSWQTISLSNEDAQFLLTREFQNAEVTRWFNVPLHMIQETSRTTSWGQGIEHLSLGFVTFSILSWLRRWEQAISRTLLGSDGDDEDDEYYVEHLVESLLRGDTASRYAAYQIARQNGWMSANEIRRRENEDPIPDPSGDDYLVPLNYAPADQLRRMALPVDPPGSRPSPASPTPPAPPAAPARPRTQEDPRG